jgi:hypothetical protein
MIHLLLAASVVTMDLSMDATVGDRSQSWTFERVEYGDMAPVTLEVDRNTQYLVDLTVTEVEQGVQFDLEVVETTHKWLGRSKSRVVSQPSLTVPMGEEATLEWGLGHDELDTSISLVANRVHIQNHPLRALW